MSVELHRGICRTVLCIGHWAIKVPTTRPYGRRGDRLWAWTRGYQANCSELDWSNVEGVAPVLWRIGKVIVCFRRCEPIQPWDIPEQDDDWWREIAPLVPFADAKAENVGLLDGKPVWIDYDGSWNGCPHSRDTASAHTSPYWVAAAERKRRAS